MEKNSEERHASVQLYGAPPAYESCKASGIRRSLRCTVCSRPKVDEIKNGIL